MKKLWILILVAVAFPLHLAAAAPLTSTRIIKAGQTILEGDLMALEGTAIAGQITDPYSIIGKAARITLYPGRAISPDMIGPPVVVTRNQVITIEYKTGNLTITAEGRALSSGGVGDVIRILNISSRNTVMGHILADHSVSVISP